MQLKLQIVTIQSQSFPRKLIKYGKDDANITSNVHQRVNQVQFPVQNSAHKSSYLFWNTIKQGFDCLSQFNNYPIEIYKQIPTPIF